MNIASDAFVDGEVIPTKFTCEGENISPPLNIDGVTETAKSLVLIMDDVDAPSGVFTHWVISDIYSGLIRIDEGGAPEGIPGKNSFGQEYYGGPCPHSGTHRYYFRIFALDTLLKLPWASDRSKIEEAMKGHVIEKAELMGRYTKK